VGGESTSATVVPLIVELTLDVVLKFWWDLTLEAFSKALVSLHLFSLEDFASKAKFDLELGCTVDHALTRPAVVNEELTLSDFESFALFEETCESTLLVKRHQNMLFQHLGGQLTTLSLGLRVLFLSLPDRCYSDPL